MDINTHKWFDFNSGIKGMRASGELRKTYFLVVLGIILHWVWGVLIAAIPEGKLDFGNWVIFGARIVIAFIVGAVSFTGIWKQLENVDSEIRLFFAVTQGFAIDALASPIAGVLNP